MRRCALSLCAAALALSVCLGAGAQTPTVAPTAPASVGEQRTAPMAQPGSGTRNAPTAKDDKVARGDRKFIVKAAEAGLFEVEMSQLAASKASDQAVKNFASMLADHHAAANSELTQLANAKGVELPVGPPKLKRRGIAKLDKLPGRKFDEHFVREVGIKSHEKDIKLFEKGGKDVKDAQLKAWIDKTLPTLREHLAQAQRLPQSGKPPRR